VSATALPIGTFTNVRRAAPLLAWGPGESLPVLAAYPATLLTTPAVQTIKRPSDWSVPA
jgi:hypothetical protein